MEQDMRIQDDHNQTVTQQDFKQPLESIVNSSNITRDYLEKLTQIQSADSADKQSKSFKKIAKKYQRMILVASSKGDVIGEDISDEGAEFFRQSNSLLAQIYLNSYLESRDIKC